MNAKLLFVFTILLLTSCGKENPVANQSKTNALEVIEVLGTYNDPYNSTHEIREDKWIVSFDGASSTYEVLSFDNEGQFMIALNGEDSFNPGEYSRFEWVYVGRELFYCQSVYDALSAKIAQEEPSSDPSDPEVQGCGSFNFPWTPLSI